MDVNKVTLIGTVLGDPKPAEASAVRFTLATSQVWRDEKSAGHHETSQRHDVLAHGRLGKIIAEYVHDGCKVFVEGRFEGSTVVANNLILLTRKSAAA